ncbi:MAG: hypothetical protein ACLP52_24715 [Streptosporangiaceae bacterium]|jgi:hypothetical protein
MTTATTPVAEVTSTVSQAAPLSLTDLRTRDSRWPPDDAASALTGTPTMADRKRDRIERAIDPNPAGSDRAIAAAARVDQKTVAACRRREAAGELPAPAGEISTACGELPTGPEIPEEEKIAAVTAPPDGR